MAKVKITATKDSPGGPMDPIVKRAKWAALREEFIELSITGRDVYWPELAQKYGFNVRTVRSRASLEKWSEEITRRAQERQDLLESKLTTRTTIALDILNKDFATNEASIRKRHALVARGLQVKAVEVLNGVAVKDISVRDALTMLKMGVDEERYAMGMPEVYTGNVVDENESAYKPITEQLGGHRRMQQVGALLLKAVQEGGVDLDLLKEAGLGPSDGPTDVQSRPVDPDPQPVPPPPKIDYLDPPKIVNNRYKHLGKNKPPKPKPDIFVKSEAKEKAKFAVKMPRRPQS